MLFLRLLLLMVAAHALCDYPLQGDFLARGKNHKAPLPGIPWWQCLAAHAMIHAGAVMVITGSLWLALAELLIHTATDYAKCDGRFTPPLAIGRTTEMCNADAFNVDQAVHVTCKVLWCACVVLGWK